jgi:hypothetical protein
MIGAEEPPDSQPPDCQEDGVQELPDRTPHHLQHSRELGRDQRLACSRGVGLDVHQHGRDHGKGGCAHTACQCVADSGHGRQVGDEWIAGAEVPPQHVREDRGGE